METIPCDRCKEPIRPEDAMDGLCSFCWNTSDDLYDEEDEDGGDCFWCGGDGWVECDDPIQCTYPHNGLGECPCSSCGGSGAAKDMTIW